MQILGFAQPDMMFSSRTSKTWVPLQKFGSRDKLIATILQIFISTSNFDLSRTWSQARSDHAAAETVTTVQDNFRRWNVVGMFAQWLLNIFLEETKL